MEGKAKAFGHPIHQMLVVFPLGLLATAVIFDIIGLAAVTGIWFRVSFYVIAAGIIGGLAAAVFGFIDWLGIPSGTRAKAIGQWHGIGNVVVVVLFAVDWFLRRGSPGALGVPAFVLEVVAILLSLVTAWLGGELVDRLGIGVDDGANPNAPSSLSRRSA